MSRYPALHAARSEYRSRRLTAAGLPVLAVLSWVVAGLLHQPPQPVPPRGDVSNLEDAPARPDAPEEIAQSAARPPRSPAPSPRGTSSARTPARTVEPRWTPAATSRPVPAAGPFPVRTTPSPSPLRPGGALEKDEKGTRTENDARTPRPSPSGTAGGTARSRGSAVTATTRPTGEAARTPVADAATRPAGPPSAQARSTPSRATAATTAKPSFSAFSAFSAPPSTERRTSFTPEPEPAPAPPALRECRGLLFPLLGCPAWAQSLWAR